jgi:hypothetical protein
LIGGAEHHIGISKKDGRQQKYSHLPLCQFLVWCRVSLN